MLPREGPISSKMEQAFEEPLRSSTASPPTAGADIFGYRIRDRLHPTEDAYFKAHQTVTGMAAKDGTIVLNPYSSLTPEEKQAVARNEATRLFMQDEKIVPDITLTPEQQKSLAGTAYATDADAAKQTIVGRILSGDPSAGEPTPAQRQEADRILRLMQERQSNREFDTGFIQESPR